MIVSSASPDTERRARVRNLAGISRSYTDGNLDVKIEAADSLALSLFGELPTEAGRLENCITVSNLWASVLILSGISSDSAQERSEKQRMMIQEIVEASNNKRPEQHKPIVRVTGGATAGPNVGFGQ